MDSHQATEVNEAEKELALQDIMRQFSVDRKGAEEVYVAMMRDVSEQAILDAAPPPKKRRKTR